LLTSPIMTAALTGANKKQDWNFFSNLGSYTLENRPEPGQVVTITCTVADGPTSSLIRLEPRKVYFVESNYTHQTNVRAYVHSSFPVDGKLPSVSCEMSDAKELLHLKEQQQHFKQKTEKTIPDHNSMTRLAQPNRWSQIVVVLAGIYIIITVWGPSLRKFLFPKKKDEQVKISGKPRKSDRKTGKRSSKLSSSYSNAKKKEVKFLGTQTPSLGIPSYEKYIVSESDAELSSSDEEEDETPKVSVVTLDNSRLDTRVNNSTAAAGGERGWETVGVSNSPSRASPTTRDRETLFTKFIFKRHKVQKHTQEESHEPAHTGPKDETSMTPQAPPTAYARADKNRELCNISSLEEQDNTTRAPNNEEDTTETEIDSLLASCRIEEPLVDERYTFALYIDGMTCSGCERVVQSTLETLADIASVVVNWRLATAAIESPVPRLDLSAVVSALNAVGMRVYLAPSPTTSNASCIVATSAAIEGCDNTTTAGVDDIMSKSTDAVSVPSPLHQLSSDDKLLLRSESKLRRYGCGWVGVEWICPHPVPAEDSDQDVVSLPDLLFSRMEENLSTADSSQSSVWSWFGTQPSTSVELLGRTMVPSPPNYVTN
jgi:copper chaperone CopZ